MSEPKVQLVDPQGNMSVTGMSAVGVITASSFDGISNSSATGITGTPDLDVGIVTATSFVGQGKGHAAGLAGTPELNLGVTTATSFVGDATGKAAGLTGTPNLTVGLVTATGFAGNVTGTVTGNVSGLAASITPGSNLGVGVCTAIQYHGDGSGLTGAGSSAYIAQNITATGAETIIDLSYGNLIYFDQGVADSTTVGFASTSAAEQITFIRKTSPSSESWNISYSTGGVDFDDTGDYLNTTSASSDFTMGTGDFTVECWVYIHDVGTISGFWQISNTSGGLATDYGDTLAVAWDHQAGEGWQIYGAGTYSKTGLSVSPPSNNTWIHTAYVRSSGTSTLYIDGTAVITQSDSHDYDGTYVAVGGYYSTGYLMDGVISNLRVLKGTALYTAAFIPPSAELTNITNTKLLCCQSDSSTTAAAVTPQTLNAQGDPTAGAQTIANTGTLTVSDYTLTWPDRVKWNGDTTPTLTNTTFEAAQIFRFTTVDTGLNYNAWQDIETQTSYNLFGWGNAYPTGQLGDNSRVTKSSPIQIDGQWSALSNGHRDRDISITFKTNELYVCGNNSFGGLGQNNLTLLSSPTQVPGTWSGGAAACMRKACIASKTDGTAWVWGHNEYGALGLNGNDNARKSSPTQLGTDATWGTSRGKFGSGWYSSFAIKTDGTLWCWGTDTDGQLGLNGPTPTSKSSPTQIGTNTNWNIFCDTGYNWVGAIKTDGTLWMWGDGDDGQLGLNTGPSPRRRSSPTQVPGTNWSNVVIGYSTLASKTDGTLWSFGKNAEGDLGLNTAGSPTSRSSPCQIPGTTWTSNIAAGGSGQFAATKTDGTLWAWGQATNGQLGLNDAVSRSSPTQIPGTKWEKMCGGQVFFSLQQP